ncbi:hypothetical protein [Psychroserpens jangbogonensis]|uniref:hypothetical protein n=1 Tax=Psychroserpens jangbogonensis TaxID=1484460 RepID=UPI00053E7E49|nr:hypothetical protein [Psychroserpens jangbogonensis]
MKKTIFMLILVATLFNCSSDDDATIPEDNSIEATLLGRWSLVGFEDNILYEFTVDKRFDIYGIDGVFGTVEEQIADGLNGLDWFYEGDQVIVDLNFGNTSILTPQFVCDNYVVNWINDDGEIHSTMFREAFDYASCNE